jgi:hypothetical protein
MKNAELCRAWDRAMDAVVDLNLIFAEVCERDGRFEKPKRRAFDLELDLSPQAQDLLLEEFGPLTGKERKRNLYPDIIGE